MKGSRSIRGMFAIGARGIGGNGKTGGGEGRHGSSIGRSKVGMGEDVSLISMTIRYVWVVHE